jgi:hypothetical protein
MISAYLDFTAALFNTIDDTQSMMHLGISDCLGMSE